MAYAVIIRHFLGTQSYLVLDDNPRELLCHPGFQEEYSQRPWLGSIEPDEAREEWAEMLGEDLIYYQLTDSDHQGYQAERQFWEALKK